MHEFVTIIRYLCASLPYGNMLLALRNTQRQDVLQHFERDGSSAVLDQVLPVLRHGDIGAEDLAPLAGLPLQITHLLDLILLRVCTHAAAYQADFYSELDRQIGQRIQQHTRGDDFAVVRELTDILFRFYSLPDSKDQQKQETYLTHYVAVTTQLMTHWPNLVGCTVVRYGAWFEAQGNAAKASEMYTNVILDLEYLIERVDDEELPLAEKLTALWWLKEAYAAKFRLHPDNTQLDKQCRRVTRLLNERGVTQVSLLPRLGLICNAVVSEHEQLVNILRDIKTCEQDQNSCTIMIVHKYGVLSDDVDFYYSAIGSYAARDILHGATMLYDDAHEKVFAAWQTLQTLQ